MLYVYTLLLNYEVFDFSKLIEKELNKFHLNHIFTKKITDNTFDKKKRISKMSHQHGIMKNIRLGRADMNFMQV